jgi:ankyrin repeat protein
MARILLAHGANPNCRDLDGDTPMHAAIKSRLVVDPTAFIELLLASGANRAILNNEGRTAAETYFPARPIAPKKLERVIELLA